MKAIIPTKEDIEKINIRGDEIREIIGTIPSWFIRYGIACIFFFILIILVGCWFFKYPDIILAQVEITVSNIPASVMSKANGRIEKIFIVDNQKVLRNQQLAIIENTAEYSEVMLMKHTIDSLIKYLQNNNTTLPIISNNILNLGEIQSTYSAFIKQYSDYCNFIALNYHQNKIDAIEIEIEQHKKYLLSLKSKLNFSKEQLILSKNQYKRDSLLFDNGVIALAEVEKTQNQYLQFKGSLESSNIDVLATEMQITKLEQSILDLKSQKLEQTTQQRNILKESYELLLARYSEWEKTYILSSPVDGTITFTHFWKINQNIKMGDVVFTIISAYSENYVAKIHIPINSSGKVKIGQRVIIKLDDYPYMEYGILYGAINKISLIPEDDYYIAEVIFPSKLITSYGTDVSIKNELKGSCEIITRNQRLLYKFINPLKALWENTKIENGQTKSL